MSLFDIFKKEKNIKRYSNDTVLAPVSGRMIPASEIKDNVFSKELMGQTIGFEPSKGTVVCPVNGTVSVIFPTCHAFGIMTENGTGFLVHIGIDTVGLKGKGFKSFIKQGDKVVAGQKAIEVDLKAVKNSGLETTTMLIVTDKPNEDFVVNYIDFGTVEMSEIISVALQKH